MAEALQSKKTLGTPAVFFTAISTILGAIMFLRFGYAVGELGFSGAVAIILIGHAITIPTAMAIAEIATNQKVEGGGEYYIISRSFGINIGGAIGVALFLSQAVSVAFYIIAFAQAFEPLLDFIMMKYNIILLFPTRTITIPFLIILLFLILKKGSGIGMKLLYFVVAILAVSLVMFFLGDGGQTTEFAQGVGKFPIYGGQGNKDFIMMFAVCFPGFTGMTAGVGLSGDLKNPSKAIPMGTMAATVVGMLIYLAIVWKLAGYATEEALVSNQLIMGEIALFGQTIPIIPLGLAAATFSSAIGSVLVAPRTLQALGVDDVFPVKKINQLISTEQKGTGEPVKATIVTSVIALSIIALLGNNVDIIAEVVSIFFMVTYGVLCLISFLEHFAADPSYRPSFKSKWYLSLIGALGCFILMFQMSPKYAVIGLGSMFGLFFLLNINKGGQGMARIFQGVISQLSRRLQVFLQKVDKDQTQDTWRPSVVSMSSESFERFAAFDLLKWISHKYGFGTFIHHIDNYLSKDSYTESTKTLDRLIKMADKTKSNVYLDTIVTPSFKGAVSQLIQLPGISGKENNMVLFEYEKEDPKRLPEIIENLALVKTAGFDIALLSSSVRNFGFKTNIHVWISSADYENANLMILMAYIIMGHQDWRKGDIKIFAVYPEEELVTQKNKLEDLIESGRLPISKNNIEVISKDDESDVKSIINKNSADADLTVIGFMNEIVKHNGQEVFNGYDALGDILFFNSTNQKEIK